MEDFIYYIPVWKLSDAVQRFKYDRAYPYHKQAAEICDALHRGMVNGVGQVAIDLVPPSPSGRIKPALKAVRVKDTRGCWFTQRAVTVYVSPDDILREEARRGEKVYYRLMWVREFLDFVGRHTLSARFLSGGTRFDLLSVKLNITKERAELSIEEEKQRREKEYPLLDAAYKKETARWDEQMKSGNGNRFFRPLFSVIAAINSDLPYDRRACHTINFLARGCSLFSYGRLLVAADEDGFIKERSMIHGVEREALTVYMTDEIPYQAIAEKGEILRYKEYDAFAFIDLARKRRLPAKFITTERELVLPAELLEWGYWIA